jgi:hypothetical protein
MIDSTTQVIDVATQPLQTKLLRMAKHRDLRCILAVCCTTLLFVAAPQSATGQNAAQFLTPPPSSGSFDTFDGVSVYFGLGTAMDISTGQAIDTYGNGTLYNTPKMAGIFESIGGDWMFWPHWGIGFRTSFRSKSDYAGLQYRPLFFDFNTIYEPLGNSREIVPELEGGLGGANLRFYEPQDCDDFAGCSSSNTYLESSNHFQVRLSAGIRGYVRGGVFLRPQVDIHWVRNFFQFGRDWFPEYSMAIGYTFGRNP